MSEGRMSTRNPFQIIGITPMALRGKNDHQVRKLLQLVGRAVIQVEHPDAGGNPERFKIVQNALEELEDPEKFSRFKRLFLQSSQKQLAKLTDEVAERTSLYQTSRRQFRSYLESFAKRDTASVLKPGNIELRMLDTVVNDRRGVHSTKPPPFFSLTISDDGMTEIRDGAIKETARVPIGCVPKSSLGTGGIKPLILRCHPNQVPKSTRPRPRLNTTDINIRTTHLDHHRSPWRLAEPVIALLRPEFETNSYLFSLSTYMDEPHLYFEGSVIALKAVDT